MRNCVDLHTGRGMHSRQGRRASLDWACANILPPASGVQPRSALRRTGGAPHGMWLHVSPCELLRWLQSACAMPHSGAVLGRAGALRRLNRPGPPVCVLGLGTPGDSPERYHPHVSQRSGFLVLKC